MPTEKPRYTIIANDNLLRQIDDLRSENRFLSHSTATLDLIRRGIEQLRKEQGTSKKDSDQE